MKNLRCFTLLIGIMIVSVSVFAVDVRWVTSITVTPNPLTTGVPGSATASFRVEGAGGIDNLRVVGGNAAGGDLMYDRTWAHIEDGATRSVSFSGTPEDPGTFTIYFQIDPDRTSPDSDRTNNRLELAVTIVPGLMPNLVNIVPGPTWTPAIFSAGELLTIHYVIGNIGDAASDDFHVGLRVDGAIVLQNSHHGMAAHAPFTEGDLIWRVVCGSSVELVVDSASDVTESDEVDNIVAVPALSACAPAPVLPNFTVEKVTLKNGDTMIGENIATYYKGKLKVGGNSATNVKVRVGIVGGAVLYETTYPIIIMNDSRNVEFKACLPKGLKKLYIEADPDGTIDETNETDNRATSTIQVIDKGGPIIGPATKPVTLTATPRKK